MNDLTPRPRDFFVAGGTLRYDAPSYVVRPADSELHHLVRNGNLCYVLTTRQMGKSSLMNRLGRQLQAQGIATALIDLTTIGTASLEEWYLSLLDDLQVQLGLETEAEAWWEDQKALSPVKRFTKFFRDIALEELEGQVVVFIDEVDSALNLDFSDDFFAAIRAIYNQTLSSEAAGRLSFVLLGVATPNELIKSQHRTPFNVGERIELEELGLAEAQSVFSQGLPVQEPPIVDRVYYWTNGHPYLTQRVCQAITRDGRQQWTAADIDELMAQLFFTERALVEESNLQFVNGRVLSSPDKEQLLQLYLQIYKGKRPVKNDERDPIQTELKLYGLIKGEPEGHLVVRNRIYRQVFDPAWIKQHQTSTWKRTAWITLILVTILSIGLSIYLWRQAQQSQQLLAETYISNFAATENPTLRLDNLAQLIALDGYTEEASNLFANLTTADKTALFSNSSADLQPQLESVIETMYVTQAVDTITADAESTQVLAAMLTALHQFDRLENPTILPEIDSWLKGRTAVEQNDLPAAQLAYSVALSLNENNPATRYERALVGLALPDDEAALADLATLLTYGEAWQNRVQETISAHPRLHARINADDTQFTELVAFVPTPTISAPLATPTEPPVSPSPEEVVVGETAVLPTPTLQPTIEPTNPPSPTRISTSISTPILSSQGQLAYIHNRVLYVETEVNSGIYQEFAQNVSFAAWSPDGSQLLYLVEPIPPNFVDCPGIESLNIWNANNRALTSLTDVIDELKTECPDTIQWAKNGQRIFFSYSIEGRASTINLKESTFSEFLQLLFITRFWELPNERVLVQEHLGTSSASLAIHDLSGEAIWYYPNTPSGAFAGANSAANYSEGHQLLVVSGPTDDQSEYEKTTVYLFDTETYELSPIWSQNTLIFDSAFSSDGQFIGLSLPREGDIYSDLRDFSIIDRDGRSYGTRENSQLLDWRPDGGPVVVQTMDDGKNQLVYWPLTGASAARIFVLPRDFRFVSGKWSADGRYFIYNALDDSIGASYLYLWQPESGIPELIHSAASTNPFENFAWMPDGSRVYFNLGHEELWSYEPETAELNLIATTHEANPP